MLIPPSTAYDEALVSIERDGLPLKKTLDMILVEAMKNDVLYDAYGAEEPVTLKALAHGVLLGLSILASAK